MQTARRKPARSSAIEAVEPIETIETVESVSSGHPQIPIVEPRSGRLIDVDVELAPMIEHLWRAGIETMHSCSGGDHGQGGGASIYGYIVVIGYDSMKRFLEAVFGGTEIPLDLIEKDRAWSGWASEHLQPLPDQQLSSGIGYCFYWPPYMTSTVVEAAIVNLDRPRLTPSRRHLVGRFLDQMSEALKSERHLSEARTPSA